MGFRSKRNRYRQEANSDNVKSLEKALPWLERFFGKMAMKRGRARLARWLLITLCAAPLLLLLGWGIMYAVDSAYRLSLDKINIESREHIINRAQVLEMLGLQGEQSVSMASIRAQMLDMEKKLSDNPCIKQAQVHAELPESLNIEIEERIPVVYVELESAADTGTRQRLFMDPDGILFPVVEAYHENFLNVPVWYLQPGDVSEFKVGAVVKESARRPIIELVAASNLYRLDEIPSIREIFRPKEWKIVVTLQDGPDVIMQVYDIRGQMGRLAMILEHARATHRKLRSVDVIPRLNPTAIYAE